MCTELHTTSAGELGELRAECAWRMGEWAAAADPVPAPQPAAGPGFHQALCGCLKALEGGDRESCGSLLDAAGVAVVRAGRPSSPFVL